MGPQKVVLYDGLSFIRGMNVEKCRPKLMLKLSFIRGLSHNAVVLNYRLHCTIN